MLRYTEAFHFVFDMSVAIYNFLIALFLCKLIKTGHTKHNISFDCIIGLNYYNTLNYRTK